MEEKIKLPDINLLMKKILPVKPSFTGDYIIVLIKRENPYNDYNF